MIFLDVQLDIKMITQKNQIIKKEINMKKLLALTLTLGTLSTFAADLQGRCASSGTTRHGVNSFVYHLDEKTQDFSLDGFDLENNKISRMPVVFNLAELDATVMHVKDQKSGEEYLNVMFEAMNPRTGLYKNFAYVCTKE